MGAQVFVLFDGHCPVTQQYQPTTMRSLVCAVALLLVNAASGRETFGIAWKGTFAGQAWPSGTELEVFNQTCSAEPCVMNHFWAGGNFAGYEQSVLRYYIDGETVASVEIAFSLGLGSDMLSKQLGAPWSAGALFGKTGEPSGIFHNYHVPFGRAIRVTVQLGGSGNQKFWIILKGTSGTPAKIDGEALPSGARARTYSNDNVSVVPGDRLPLLLSSAQNGAVLVTALKADNWARETFLEGCVRAEEPATGKVRSIYSSGTEDYFLGTYYFNRGMYANPVAGLTDLDKNGKTFSAYRVHDTDPLYFEQGLNLTWRNGDPYMSCDLSEVNGASGLRASTFALVYEWTNSAAVV